VSTGLLIGELFEVHSDSQSLFKLSDGLAFRGRVTTVTQQSRVHTRWIFVQFLVFGRFSCGVRVWDVRGSGGFGT
jgi:hypothetical protein